MHHQSIYLKQYRLGCVFGSCMMQIVARTFYGDLSLSFQANVRAVFQIIPQTLPSV